MRKRWWMVLAAVIMVAAFASPFAASSPDGLERVAEDKGFMHRNTSYLAAPVADYLFPGINNEGVATAVAGVFGTVFTFGFMYGISRLVVIRKKKKDEPI